MHVISRKKLRDFAAIHRDADVPLNTWFKTASKAVWTTFAEVRAAFPHADVVGTCVIFNVGGNKYRLIARIRYASGEFGGRAYVRHVLTHKDYDAGHWKADCDCE